MMLVHVGRWVSHNIPHVALTDVPARLARQIWAMLTKNEDYRDPALATA